MLLDNIPVPSPRGLHNPLWTQCPNDCLPQVGNARESFDHGEFPSTSFLCSFVLHLNAVLIIPFMYGMFSLRITLMWTYRLMCIDHLWQGNVRQELLSFSIMAVPGSGSCLPGGSPPSPLKRKMSIHNAIQSKSEHVSVLDSSEAHPFAC